jgi:hypothetical protein
MHEHSVKKGSHCAWQIHYHIVFPVKYRKALLDEEVVQIIVETARGIEERYDMEFEQLGCDGDHIHLSIMYGASEDIARPDSQGIQEHHGEGDLSRKADGEESVMGRRVLDGWLLCGDGWGTRRLGSGRALRTQPRQSTRVAASTRVVLIPRALGAG